MQESMAMEHRTWACMRRVPLVLASLHLGGQPKLDLTAPALPTNQCPFFGIFCIASIVFGVCSYKHIHCMYNRKARRRQKVANASLLPCSSAHRHKCNLAHLGSDLGLHEGESLLPVFTSIALVSGSVAAVAAVRVSCVAVGLDLGGTWAREARRAGIKLCDQG